MKNNKNELIMLFAFIALFLSGLILLIGALFPNLAILGILSIIKDTSLLLAIMLPAYDYAKRLGNVWVIIYWILVIIFVVGFIMSGVSKI